MTKKILHTNIILFSLVIFLLRIPNIYLFFHHSLFLTNNIARVLILFLLLINFQKLSLFRKKQMKILLGFVLVYLLSQSLSLLEAINLKAFFYMYKDLVFGLLIFLTTILIVNEKNKKAVLKILILTIFINIFFQLAFYFFPAVVNFFNHIANEKYLQFFNYQFSRNRFFGDSLDEAFIPLLFAFFIRENRTLRKMFYFLFLGLILFIVIISNWRTKAIILLFSFFSSLFFFFRNTKKYIKNIFIFLFISLILGNFISLNLSGRNVIDRFLDVDRYSSKANKSRIRYWNSAWRMGISSPFFGVGLGNYYDNLSEKEKISNKNISILRKNRFILIDDPHNLFFSTLSMTGFAGLFSLLGLLIYFVLRDGFYFSRLDIFFQALVITFWGIFIYAFLNPWIYFAYLSQFWLIRGIIEKLKYLNEKK